MCCGVVEGVGLPHKLGHSLRHKHCSRALESQKPFKVAALGIALERNCGLKELTIQGCFSEGESCEAGPATTCIDLACSLTGLSMAPDIPKQQVEQCRLGSELECCSLCQSWPLTMTEKV